MALFARVQNFLLGGDDEDEMENEQQEEVSSFDDSSFKKREYEKRNEGINRAQRSSVNHDNVTRLYPDVKYEIVVSKPETIDHAPAVVNNVRANNVCIVNLEGIEKAKAQRIADFLGGCSYALGGSIERITNEIFVMAPGGINISGKLKNELKSESSILSWVSGR
jgi:cell division inhibitor SepF